MSTLEKCAEVKADLAHLKSALSDPVAVHVNMLRGSIAKPSVAAIMHIYGDELTAAIAQHIGHNLDENVVESAVQAWLESASDYTQLKESISKAIVAYLTTIAEQER